MFHTSIKQQLQMFNNGANNGLEGTSINLFTLGVSTITGYCYFN